MEHAVVLGAGVSGLCAARGLAGHARRITIVERDVLDDSGGHRGPALPRRGVPQGRHVHALLGTGSMALERLFPGLAEELVRAGAVRSQLLSQARYVLGGAPLARGETGVVALQATRPLLESVLRRRVRALDNVDFLDGHDVLGPVFQNGRVTGARVQPRTDGPAGTPDGAEPGTERAGQESGAGGAGEPVTLSASLVVDATGRAGRSSTWLAAAGFTPPEEERTRIDVGYATRFLRLPEGALDGDRTVLSGSVPGRPGRGCGLFLQEEGRWILTVAGMAGDHPSTHEPGFAAFADSVLPADVAAVVRAAEPLSEPVLHRFPYSVWRRFERLERLPDGLLAIGDAVCSFNPVYGQGMTVAALEAEALESCLRSGLPGLPRRYFARAARAVAPAWELARAADLAVPEVPGRRPPLSGVTGRYLDRVLTAAHRDPGLAALYVRVVSMLTPRSRLVHPRVLRRVLRAGRGVRG
ncbi:NAD(P)/FAD-dependent oxidoreductase [Streptomyces cacaoi]